MGRPPREGVVDDRGEVFGRRACSSPTARCSLARSGPNPSLTIAAVADRSADADGRARPDRKRVRPQRVTTVSFTEELEGWISFDEADFNQALLAAGRARRRGCG